jgi:deoxyribodipyrimidine photo-lyase
MRTLIFWFRNDLRLHDHPALCQAAAQGSALLPVFCLGGVSALHNGDTRWGDLQPSLNRQRVLLDSLIDLDAQLRALGSALMVVRGTPVDALPKLAQALGGAAIYCETIAAPYEQNEVDMLQSAGVQVVSNWQSTLFAPDALPFAVQDLPKVFTQFRHALTRAQVAPTAPLPAPTQLPPLPTTANDLTRHAANASSDVSPQGSTPGSAQGYARVSLPERRAALGAPETDPRSSLPYWQSGFAAGERAGLAHLAGYFASELPHRYKATRNALTGTDFSSKLSAWLASGALSVRQVAQCITDYEQGIGPNEGSQWLLQELLWRDYFRWLHLQHGAKLFRYRGLRDMEAPAPALAIERPPAHNPAQFARWSQGSTEEPLVNAAMHELQATGYLSNRLRQVVASYWIHELAGDWRAGAAWFEAQLIDYDVCTNQGNWLYIAGMGTDPRGGRHFNVQKQAQAHDPDRSYQRLWQTV